MDLAGMKPQLYLEMDMQAPEILPLAGGEACVFTQRRPGRESANEDAAAIIPCNMDSGVIAVADGLGGLPAGNLAAGLALQHLSEHVDGQHGDAQREAVLDGLELANEAILASGQGSATTIAVVGIDGTTVRAYHAGDAMILITGQRGRIKYQSMAHSPTGYAEASGMLDEESAMFHNERHLVSNMVGMAGMRIEMSPPVELAPRDTVVVASDGLFDNLYIGEIVDLVRIGPLEVAAGRLLDRCRERMAGSDSNHPRKPDDVAFILYRRGSRR
jgi:serine/threonine protein phosphatase PrpC